MVRVSSQEEQFQRMVETPIPRLVSSLFLPTICSMLVSTLYNTADTYFVSQIGTSAAAAVGAVFSLMSIIQAVGFGLGMGTGSLISRRLGEKRNEEANSIASTGFFSAILFGILLMLVGLITLRPLMRLLGSTETMLPFSMDYARYILIGAPVMCSSFVLNNILRSEGEAMQSMIGLCTGGVVNIALDPLFIFTLNMGISGAALATVLSQCVSFFILLRFFLAGKSRVCIRLRTVSRSLNGYAEIVVTGFPTICRQGMASVASALLNNQAAIYGDAAVAAVTIANKIYIFVRNIIIGMGQGFLPVAGYNYGAKRYSRVREAFHFVVRLGTVFCIVAAVIIYMKADGIIHWFRHDDAEVIAIGARSLRYAALVMPLMAFSTFVNQIYQGLGFSREAAFLASCRQGVCFVPIILLLPPLLGLTAVEAAQPLSDLATFFICIPYSSRFFRRLLPKADDVDNAA